MDHDLDAALDAVGQRLKRLRLDGDVTLVELAERTGISASTLSRLESGTRRPTLEQLLPLARVHGVTLDELVDAPETGDPRVHLRAFDGPEGRRFLPLSRRTEGIQAFKMILPAGSGVGEPDPRVHEGYEWLYVLDGRLRLVLGDRDLVMGAGEAAEFDTRTPHWFGAAGDEPVECLCLIGRQGERAHVRAAPASRAPSSRR